MTRAVMGPEAGIPLTGRRLMVLGSVDIVIVSI